MPAPPQEDTAMKEKPIKYDLFQLTYFYCTNVSRYINFRKEEEYEQERFKEDGENFKF